MGPPKRKPPRKSFGDRTKESNTFEYRWNKQEGHYYLFNPYTGETILGDNYENINRNDSMWAKPDKPISRQAYTIQLYHEPFKARTWGIRPIPKPLTKELAATIITAAVRGHISRESLRVYYKERFHLEICRFSGYYYFVDKYTVSDDGSAVTSWHKPVLSRPGDITEPVIFDPDDHMADGLKYGMRSFEKGPYLAQASLGKGNVTRVPQKAFLIETEWRKSAVSTNEEIPLDTPLGTVIAWFDGLKAGTLTISHYVQARAAICNNNWDATLALWDSQPDHILTRLYCFHNFTKSEIPTDGTGLSFAAAEVMRRMIEAFTNKHHPAKILEKCFMLRVLHSLLSVRAGRAEYFSTKDIKEEGDDRQKAIDLFNRNRVSLYNRFLGYIPTEVELTSNKGINSKFYKVRHPTVASCELVGNILQVLGDLATESEYKELMSETVVEYVYYAMKVCQEHGAIVMYGFKIFYALIYRCESAQQMILCGDSLGALRRARENHGGDTEVMRHTRKFELAAKHNGWRGYVEKLIEVEMKGGHIPRKYLKAAEYEREFSAGFKFPLENAEIERLEAEEEEEERLAEIEKLAEDEREFQRVKSAERAASRDSARTASRENTPIRVIKANEDLAKMQEDFAGLFTGDGDGGSDSESSLVGNGNIVGKIGASSQDGGADVQQTGRRKSVQFDEFPDFADAKQGEGADAGGDILAHINSLQGKVRDVKESLLDDQLAWMMPGPSDTDIDMPNVGDFADLGDMPSGIDGGGSIVSAMTDFMDNDNQSATSARSIGADRGMDSPDPKEAPLSPRRTQAKDEKDYK